MKRGLIALLFTVFLAPLAYAHDGDHKVMGTVSTIHENHLEVKATSGKTSTITLNEKTRILRGKTALKAADIKEGDRVVVIATEQKGSDGKATLVAKEIRLGTASSSTAKK